MLLSSDDAVPDSLVAKVADFGLARDFSAASRIQAAKYGTITHMPPELLTEGTLTKVSCSPPSCPPWLLDKFGSQRCARIMGGALPNWSQGCTLLHAKGLIVILVCDPPVTYLPVHQMAIRTLMKHVFYP